MHALTLPHTAAQQDQILRRLTYLARLMDVQFRLPGTRFRFGLDGLIGLIPGIGDIAGAAVSGYIIYEAKRLGASNWILARMIGNVLIELVVGAIPVVGDAFDVVFKANVRNLKLLGIGVEAEGEARVR